MKSNEYFDIPWMAELLIGRSSFLINLRKEQDELLSDHGVSGIMELLLKRASDSNFIPWLKENYKLIGTISVEHILSISIDYAL